MFGLEILDVVIGLMFVYLLLSLLATAINEHISAVVNRRGKELARGIGRLLDDLEASEALDHAFRGVGTKAAGSSAAGSATAPATRSITERFYDHPLIRPLATRRGRLFGPFNKAPRLPSYIPARTFGLALLDVLGYGEPSADDPAPIPGSKEEVLVSIMKILKRESPLDLSERKSMLEKALPADAVQRVMEASTAAEPRLQHLHDGVEVWFNNAMDRVSGAYKRNVQGWLLAIGIVIAFAMNADTIQMWRQLAANDELAKAMAQGAAAALPLLDSAAHHTPATQPSVDSARARYQAARARLDSMELKLGWSGDDQWPAGAWPSLYKIIGLLLTGTAISLGAPFWFDMLNKVISIRAAGRSPEEKPKSPEGSPKRLAEHTPK
jgi:hypothetical protein